MGKSTRKSGEWSTDPRDALRAGPDFDLAAFDRGGKPGFDGSKADAEALQQARGELLSQLQERLFAEGRTGGKRAVLCVVQGLDTAGKGGVARHVMSMVDPQGVALRSFGPPTEEERQHDFLWRIKNALPPVGKIGVFDRSHYEDVLVVRVEELVPAEEWQKRYDIINEFEKQLVESGTIVVKFALMVGYEEQGLRLMERLDRPDKLWKFSPNDVKTRAKWDAYQEAYQAVFARTSTEWAPWYVIPADRKWYSHLAITEILTQTMIEMDLGWPAPTYDPAEMRAQLAEQMSVESLAASLAATEATVKAAIKADAQVEKDAAEAVISDGDTASEQAEARAVRAEAKARRASELAQLERTRAQKQTLLEQARLRDN